MSQDEPEILGSVIFSAGRVDLVADWTWRASTPYGDRDAALESLLFSLYGDASPWRGPAMGRPGAALLADVAEQFKGTAELPPDPDEAAGEVC